ncbi:MAG: formylglycine-generating enzyme family protein [Acidobacteria bacterium]|nr:formylglycine-generating enzyme family protein [Acidobacteriota bacterium]
MRRALGFAIACMGAAACAPGPPAAWTEPRTRMEFVLIPSGRFTMGTPRSEPGREAQELQHDVTLTRPFYLGRTEVTQAQWALVMGSNPSAFQDCGPSCPVETVSAIRIDTFLARLDDLAGVRFRLPSEAEWEYSCRAGTRTAFATGEKLDTTQAGFDRARPSPVASFPPNAWGLFDMHGNVWEWTGDEICPYPEGPSVDPVGRCASDRRVIRGGSWAFGADSARCGLRYTHHPEDSGYSLGFRLVREIAP